MAALRLHRTADGVGATFPDDVLERMKVGEGDTPDVHHTPDGSYAWGLARNHAGVDGNYRSSFMACVAFPSMNGLVVDAKDDDKISTWLALAAGPLDEDALTEWLRTRTSTSP